MLTADPMDVVVAGVGGQGNVVVSQILGLAAMARGYNVMIGESYGASQRGGSVMSHLRLSRTDPGGPLIPEGGAQLIVGLEPTESLRMLGRYGHPEVLVLTNTRPVHSLDVLTGDASYPALEQVIDQIKQLSRRTWTVAATELALELGQPILANIVLLGALGALDLLPFDRAGFATALAEALPTAAVDVNLRAFDLGGERVVEV
jgi:indolepyruvate ferredoxin oxidoreductase beta subunit